MEITVLIHSRITSWNGPLFQPSDQVSGCKFLANTIYYSLYIFLNCSLPEIFNYSMKESKVGYAYFHLDSSQYYQLGPSLSSHTPLCKQSSCTTHLFHWGNTKDIYAELSINSEMPAHLESCL